MSFVLLATRDRQDPLKASEHAEKYSKRFVGHLFVGFLASLVAGTSHPKIYRGTLTL